MACCCSVAQSCWTLCDLMKYSMPGLLVPHHLLKFAQVHVSCIGDAIHPSHPLTLPSPSTLNHSQNPGLFQWVICSHQMTKVLELQLQHQSFPKELRGDFPQVWLVWSSWCPRNFQWSSPAPQFEGIHSLVLFFLYGPLSQPYVITGKTIALVIWTFVGRVMSLPFNTLSKFVIAFLHVIPK